MALHAGARGLRRLAAILACAGLGVGAAARADAGALTFSPERTQIQFTLAATLHTVEGTMKLRQGALHFDEQSGSASGTLVIDARSAQTGNARRDATMHAEVLESEKYPEIVFEVQRVGLERQGPDRGKAVLHGHVRIHGGEQRLDVLGEFERSPDGSVRVRAHFQVPYVAWGLRDESNFVLHVAPVVDVSVDATAKYASDAAPTADASGAQP